jgi:hypothetical protein
VPVNPRLTGFREFDFLIFSTQNPLEGENVCMCPREKSQVTMRIKNSVDARAMNAISESRIKESELKASSCIAAKANETLETTLFKLIEL